MRTADLLPGARRPDDPAGAPDVVDTVRSVTTVDTDTDTVGSGASSIQLRGSLDCTDSPQEVVDLLALEAFTLGRQPFACGTCLEDVRPEAPLAPADARLQRQVVTDGRRVRLLHGDGWTVRCTFWPGTRNAEILVTATSAELAESVLAASRKDAVEPAEPEAQRVTIGFWHQSGHGPRRRPRDIDAPDWSQIRGNYTTRAATAIDALMRLSGGPANGRLLLLHGPPGTGKTTLLRSLARQWRSWCQLDCVLDPERLFAEPGYLMEVALGVQDDDGEERWRLLLLEDCDELIRSEAKASTGQALSRLLNLTDGLLGQGRNVLVAITTNEDLARLHPAVVRPGRSLARLEVGRLAPREAAAWLAAAPGASDAVRLPDRLRRDGATLAELFELRTGTDIVNVDAAEPEYGCYL